jgi:hypothetical protein
VVDDLYKSLRYFSMCCSLLLEILYQCMIGQALNDHVSSIVLNLNLKKYHIKSYLIMLTLFSKSYRLLFSLTTDINSLSHNVIIHRLVTVYNKPT